MILIGRRTQIKSPELILTDRGLSTGLGSGELGKDSTAIDVTNEAAFVGSGNGGGLGFDPSRAGWRVEGSPETEISGLSGVAANAGVPVADSRLGEKACRMKRDKLGLWARVGRPACVERVGKIRRAVAGEQGDGGVRGRAIDEELVDAVAVVSKENGPQHRNVFDAAINGGKYALHGVPKGRRWPCQPGEDLWKRLAFVWKSQGAEEKANSQRRAVLVQADHKLVESVGIRYATAATEEVASDGIVGVREDAVAILI